MSKRKYYYDFHSLSFKQVKSKKIPWTLITVIFSLISVGLYFYISSNNNQVKEFDINLNTKKLDSLNKEMEKVSKELNKSQTIAIKRRKDFDISQDLITNQSSILASHSKLMAQNDSTLKFQQKKIKELNHIINLKENNIKSFIDYLDENSKNKIFMNKVIAFIIGFLSSYLVAYIFNRKKSIKN